MCVFVFVLTDQSAPFTFTSHTHTHSLRYVQTHTSQCASSCVCVCVLIHYWSAPESFWVFASPACRTRCWTLDLCSPQSPSCTSPAGHKEAEEHLTFRNLHPKNPPWATTSARVWATLIFQHRRVAIFTKMLKISWWVKLIRWFKKHKWQLLASVPLNKRKAASCRGDEQSSSSSHRAGAGALRRSEAADPWTNEQMTQLKRLCVKVEFHLWKRPHGRNNYTRQRWNELHWL